MTAGWMQSLSDQGSKVVADASVIIYLNSSGHAEEIFSELACDFIVPEPVIVEIESGRSKGNKDADFLQKMLDSSFLRAEKLGLVGTVVSDRLADKLVNPHVHEGEASVIGCAVENFGNALIDEKRARRLCRNHIPALPIGCTAELLLSPCVRKILGPSTQSEALHRAVNHGNLYVPKSLDYAVSKITGSMEYKIDIRPPDPNPW